ARPGFPPSPPWGRGWTAPAFSSAGAGRVRGSPACAPLRSGQLAQSPFSFLHVLEREFTGFNQVRHHGLSAPAEQRQQVVDQPPLRGVAGDCRCENVKITDFPGATQGLLPFQTINGSLDGRVGWSVPLGKCFLNFANGGLAPSPQRLHDLKFELR